MTFLESPRFPDNIAFGATVGPTYQTVVSTVYSGREQRQIAWTQARIQFQIGRRVMNAADTAAVDAFFRAVKGQGYGFRIKDWTDFTDGGVGTLVPTSTAGVYQMAKVYTTGSLSESRLIQKPVVGAVQIFEAGALLTTGVSIDSTTGLVTLAPTPTGSLSWVGQFDVPVRFAIDQMQKQIMDRNGPTGDLLVNWDSVPIIEIRV